MRHATALSSRFTVILVSAALLAAQGQPQSVDVRGQVKGMREDPKSFARVQLSGPGSYIALTNSNGEFSIQNVIPGRYGVTVTQGRNVQKFSIVIRVPRNTVSTIDMIVSW